MLTDDELIAGFEAGTLTDFPHAAHVRLTLAYLARHGRDETLRRLLDGLRRFAAAKGHPEKFHVTMTRAWLEAIWATRSAHPELDAEALVEACPDLLNRDLLLRFYSPERLHSDEARTRWMPPDRATIAGI
jgi:hypothetical protein